MTRDAARQDRRRAAALIELRRWEDAIPFLRRAITADAQAVWPRMELARCLRELERYDEALAEIDAALAISPEHSPSHQLRGIVQSRRNEYADAAESLREAVRLDPESPESHQLFNYLARRPEFQEEVLAAAREALRLRPDDAWMWFSLGRAQTDPVESIDAYRESLSLDPENALTHNNIAVELMKLGQLDEAETHLRRVLELEPGERTAPLARGNLARIAWMRGEYKKADAMLLSLRLERMEQYERALELNPDDVTSEDRLVAILWALGRRDEAWARLQGALRRHPDSRDLWETLSWMSRELGRLQLARYASKRVLATDPRRTSALAALATTELLADRRDSLNAVATRLHEIAPESAIATRTLGDVHLAAGEWEQAVEHFERAWALQPLRCCYAVRVGVARARAGDIDAAEEVWDRRRRIEPLDCHCAMIRVFADLLGKELP